MDELIMPLEGQVINGLSIKDKSRLLDKTAKIIQDRGLDPNTLANALNDGGGNINKRSRCF